jgi:hypothetical protein
MRVTGGSIFTASREPSLLAKRTRVTVRVTVPVFLTFIRSGGALSSCASKFSLVFSEISPMVSAASGTDCLCMLDMRIRLEVSMPSRSIIIRIATTELMAFLLLSILKLHSPKTRNMRVFKGKSWWIVVEARRCV